MEKIIQFLLSLLVRLYPEFKYGMIAKGNLYFIESVSADDKKAVEALERSCDVPYIIAGLVQLWDKLDEARLFRNVSEYALGITSENASLRYPVLIGLMRKRLFPIGVINKMVNHQLKNLEIKSTYDFKVGACRLFVIESALHRVAYYHITNPNVSLSEKNFWRWAIIDDHASRPYCNDKVADGMLAFAIKGLQQSQLRDLYGRIPCQSYSRPIIDRLFREVTCQI